PLARLRAALDALGLAREDTVAETEDHFACLCEVMRYLIAGDDVAVANLTRQRAFFADHIQPWAPQMVDAIGAHPQARFYAALATFTAAFLAVEAQGFDMLP
ncbi:MAG: molecular chaperone TorD family protein, partial [Rhodoferax sp.]|nr:molecular chaperone TorD family protein [Rhodoferax sp.]